MTLNIVQKIVIWAVPVVFAITLHEVAHGLVAWRLGDPTAKLVGRLTLNPLRHVDPIGTVAVPLGLLLLSSFFGGGAFLFGWAKPVPIGVRNLRHQRRDMALVSAAGPLANLLMAAFWALMIRVGFDLASTWPALGRPLALAGAAGVSINSLLCAFNLLPLPPLDGGRVLSSLLPPRLSSRYDRIEPFGFMILIGLLFVGALSWVLGPLILWLGYLFSHVAGITPYELFGLIRVLY